MKLKYVLQDLARHPWAILPGKLEAIMEVVGHHAAGRPGVAFEAAAPRVPLAQGGVAVIPVVGVISQRMNMMSAFSGGTSTDLLAQQIDQAAGDPNVKGIVLDVDSPGGSVYGVAEVADRIFRARETKRVVAVANSLMASAAYWIGTAAEEVFVTPGGEAGSVGVVAAHLDASQALEAEGLKYTLVTAGKYKAEGNEFAPLDPEAQAFLQSRVDDYYEMFTKAVARHRGTTADAVRSGFGEGRVVGAKQAVALGMADRIGTLQDAIIRAGQRRATRTDDRARAVRLLALD